MQLREKFRSHQSNGRYLKDSAMDSASTLSNEFKSFVSDVEGMVKRSASLHGEDLEKARGEINRRVSEAKDIIDENSQSLMRRARTGAREATDYAQSHPWGVAGVTLALGLVCGIILNNRRD